MDSNLKLYELKGRVEAVKAYVKAISKYGIDKELVIRMLDPEDDWIPDGKEEE